MEKNFQELEIIKSLLWNRTQQRILSQPNRVTSTRRHKGERKPRLLPVLRGLFVCGYHPDRQLLIANGRSANMVCPTCQETDRQLYSYLDLKEATALVTQEIARRLIDDDSLLSQAIATCRQMLGTLDNALPERRRVLVRQRDDYEQRIDFTLETAPVEPGKARDRAVEKIAEFRRKQEKAELQIEELDLQQQQQVAIPDEAAIREELKRFTEIMAVAEDSKDELLRARAKLLVSKVVDGQIRVFQAGPRVKYKGWCRLEFTLNPLAFWDGLQAACDVPGETISIEIPQPQPPFQKMADKVKELSGQGLNFKQIGEKLGYGETFVSRSYKYWYTSRDLTPPTGHELLKRLPRPPRLAERLADDVMALVNQDVPLTDIARRFNTSRNRVTEAIKVWHERRDLPVPDGRALRKARTLRKKQAAKAQAAKGSPKTSTVKPIENPQPVAEAVTEELAVGEPPMGKPIDDERTGTRRAG